MMMNCSVYSDTSGIIVATGTKNESLPVTGSALQTPDVSHSHLTALLRRKAKTAPKSAGRTFWASFLNHYRSQHANTNS